LSNLLLEGSFQDLKTTVKKKLGVSSGDDIHLLYKDNEVMVDLADGV
jgi:hypothetical protein